MKAVRFSQFGGPEVLEIVDLPDPHPGPGQVRIAVRAAGVNPSDWKKRKGLMDSELPQTMGHEAAGVVDELGEGVADVAVGDRVFGFDSEGAAQAELAVLSNYAPIPPSLDFSGAAALPAAIETATRALDQLGVGSGSTLLINGASGSVGSAAVQLAVVRGARVIGTASPANHDYLRSLGVRARRLRRGPRRAGSRACAGRRRRRARRRGERGAARGGHAVTKGLVHARQVREAARLITESRRPVLYVGGGVIKARAAGQLRELAELTRHPRGHHVDGQGRVPRPAPAAHGHARHARHGNGGRRAATGRSHHRAGHQV